MNSKTCGICICEILDEKTYSCSKNHHICGTCMDRYIEQSSDNLVILDYWKSHSNLKCFECGGHFNDEIMIESGNLNYVKFSRNIIKTITTLDIQSASMKKEEENYLVVIKNEIREELSKCISCPYCNTVFVDFSGCMALTCENCGKQICGVCCKKHPTLIDSHDMVTSHISKYTDEFKRKYGFHSVYFISDIGWELWKDKLKTDTIITYLSKLRIEIVWSSINEILTMLRTEELLSIEGINNVRLSVYSGGLSLENRGVHLLRIPIVFWTLYSYKKDCKFEDAMKRYSLSIDEKIMIGNIIKRRIISKYRHFETIKYKVPGEPYEAINYPIEMASTIYEIIEEWGRSRAIW